MTRSNSSGLSQVIWIGPCVILYITPPVFRGNSGTHISDVKGARTAHRFVELHRDSLAVVFPQRDRCRYVVARVGFPSLRVSAGARIPPLPHAPAGRKMSAREEVDGADWLRDPARREALRTDTPLTRPVSR